jgi:hypothetical protein
MEERLQSAVEIKLIDTETEIEKEILSQLRIKNRNGQSVHNAGVEESILRADLRVRAPVLEAKLDKVAIDVQTLVGRDVPVAGFWDHLRAEKQKYYTKKLNIPLLFNLFEKPWLDQRSTANHQP